MKPRGDIHISIERRDRSCFDGFAYDAARPERRFAVQALIDGDTVAVLRAELFRGDLAAKGIGDGSYGFSFAVPPTLLETARMIEARIANCDDLLGKVLLLSGDAPKPARPEAGAVDWTGGLRFTGWLAGDVEATPWVRVFLDESIVAEAPAARWSHVDPPSSSPKRGFDLLLPDRFADGKVWTV